MVAFASKRLFVTYVPRSCHGFIVARHPHKANGMRPLPTGIHFYNAFEERIVKVKPTHEVERHYLLNQYKCMEVDVKMTTQHPERACKLVLQRYVPVEEVVRDKIVTHAPALTMDVPAISMGNFEVVVQESLKQHAQGWGVTVDKVKILVRDHVDHEIGDGLQRLY